MAQINLTLDLNGEQFTDLVTALHAQGYVFQQAAGSKVITDDERRLFGRRAASITTVLEQLFTTEQPAGPVGTCRHSIS